MTVLEDHPTILLVALGSLPLVIFIKQWFRPKPIPGIPHFPITSIWGDIPAMDKDIKERGTFMEVGGLAEKAVHELGPIFQVNELVRNTLFSPL